MKTSKEQLIKMIDGMRKLKHPTMNEYPQSMTNEEVLNALIEKGEIEKG